MTHDIATSDDVQTFVNCGRLYVTSIISVYRISFWDHASVRLPGVLQTNVGHSNFRYV